jgi:antitoxin component of MazEF toxin-antitoxin module
LVHEYKVERKLQEQGGSYFVVLPKIWIESLGLKEGDPMSIFFNGIIKVVPSDKQTIGEDRKINKLGGHPHASPRQLYPM